MRTWVARIGGIVVIVFGLHMTGVFRLRFLEYDVRIHTDPDRTWGYLSSFLMGFFFSAGWSPCVGPVLGAVLTLALNSGQINRGVVLLSAYSMGLAIPFLLAALGIGGVVDLMRRHKKAIHYLSIATGAILVLVGVLLLTGSLSRLAGLGFFIDLGL